MTEDEFIKARSLYYDSLLVCEYGEYDILKQNIDIKVMTNSFSDQSEEVIHENTYDQNSI